MAPESKDDTHNKGTVSSSGYLQCCWLKKRTGRRVGGTAGYEPKRGHSWQAMDRRRRTSSQQRRLEADNASPGETADQQLERMHRELQDAPTGTVAPQGTAETSGNAGVGGSAGGSSLLAGLAHVDASGFLDSGNTGAHRLELRRVTAGDGQGGGDGLPSSTSSGSAPGTGQEGSGTGVVAGGEPLATVVETKHDGSGTGSRDDGFESAPEAPPGIDLGMDGRVNVSGGNRLDPPRTSEAPKQEVPVNAFWSPARKAFERLHGEKLDPAYGSDVHPQLTPEVIAHEMRRQGFEGYGDHQPQLFGETPPKGSQHGTPGAVGFMGHGSLGNTPQNQGYVELDPIELFRIRCLREAEEKFMKGMENLLNQQRRGPQNPKKGVQSDGASQASWASVDDGGFVPPPPPGPPPASPPRDMVGHVGFVPPPPPPPPFPVIPPMPGMDGMSRSVGMVGENPNDTLRTFDLPKLSSSATPLQFGDWWVSLDASMGDLSYGSNQWWNLLKVGIERSYQEWLTADPITKLRLKPQVDTVSEAWPRTERRALAMLLQAIPESLRQDLVASRRLNVPQVLFKLLTTFQPGGNSERTMLLHQITDGKCSDKPCEMLEWVRAWRRNVTRATELGVTVPDPMVLLRALQGLNDWLCQRNPQIAYRLNSVRQQLNVDQKPSFSGVWEFSEHLLAESETMVVSQDFGGTTNPPKGSKPSVKAVQGPFGGSQNPPRDETTKPGSGGAVAVNAEAVTSQNPCKFWMTDDGCKRSDKCKFKHSILSSKDNRCFACSAVGHSKKDCPNFGGKRGLPKPK